MNAVLSGIATTKDKPCAATSGAISPAVENQPTAEAPSAAIASLDAHRPPRAPGLDEVTLKAAVGLATETARSVLEVLQERSELTPRELSRQLARLLEYRFIDVPELDQLEPAFDLLSPAEATRRRCVLVREGAHLLAVIADPFDAGLRGWLEMRVDDVLEWALAPAAELAGLILRRAEALRAIDAALAGAEAPTESDTGAQELSYVSIAEDSSPIVRLVHSTVYDALRAGASDIHLESTASGLVVRYRLDGVLVNVASVAGTAVAEQVISRIKVMSELDIAERRVPQDGRFTIHRDGRAIDFRVSVIPSIFGEDAVLRALDKQALTERLQGLRLDSLGFDATIVTALRRLSALPYGMILVTGPTGSGKTTSLYAAISETQTGTEKIVTIEDPVEYQLKGVLQIPVNEKKGLTFARGLRSILRHDPDKIMVGEIRDPETAQIAVQSALTGHLVFTTVHANNAFDVMSRFVHMGIDSYSLVSALSGVMAQRLIRVICEQCAERYVPSRQLLEDSQVSLDASDRWDFSLGRGCTQCRGTGYHGRKAIGELMVLNDELREAIIGRAPVRQLREIAQRSGMQLIRQVALDLVRHGQTTLEEANRVTVMA